MTPSASILIIPESIKLTCLKMKLGYLIGTKGDKFLSLWFSKIK